MIKKIDQPSLDLQISTPTKIDSSENQFLLCCIRSQLNSAKASDVQDLLRTDLDWDILLQNAVNQNVFMLLYRTLKQNQSQGVPLSVFERIENEAQKRMTYNLFLTNKLLQTLKLFAEHKIQAIPFKGPIWAHLAYGNMGLREFSDLDVLVRPEDYSKAKDVLIEQGYYDKHFGGLEESIGEAQMVLPDGRVNIDLHYKLTPQNFYLQIEKESFFDNLQTLSLSGKEVATFSPENCLALGYLQGAKDSWNSLKRICDFGALIQTYPEANWQKVIAQCGTDENDRVFLLGIAIAQTYLQVSLPERFSEKLKQFPEVVKLARQHEAYMYHKNMEYSYIFYIVSLWEKREITLWSKLQYVLKITFRVNASDREALALPRFLFFLYYPLRIVRLIKTYKIDPKKISSLWNSFKG
ncbi:nucleotidyltransferase domain-containing protein [Roseofilum capinflatum]|uniref:Nucleotidyltransferase family protein n=1 Tax=Roseofilum capinflatum BLCC-M114 TaxID=3022440 RepID=A0ABT7B470_9CYAN|nr:nucleotidyltransferase family protein [Roseofilum capinflatum]MDJ1173971.1 nucleotidyltransferase family protein [Roseofilum capinflatum BLCC-M114]